MTVSWRHAPSPLSPWRFAVLSLLAVGVFVAWLSSHTGTPFARQAVSDLVFVIAPVIAALSCRAAARPDGPLRRSWWWFEVGCWVWSFGSAAWAYYELVLRTTAPFPSVADVGYIGWAIPVTIGLMRRRIVLGSSWSRVRVGLDGLAIVVTLLVASSAWVLEPVLDATNNWTFARVDALAYPLVDVVIAALVLSRWATVVSARKLPWVCLAAGLLVEAGTDSTYVARTWTGSYSPGGLLDAGWLASFLLIALAARIYTAAETAAASAPAATNDSAPGSAGATSVLQQFIPYLTIAVGISGFVHDGDNYWVHGRYFWVTCVVVAVIGVRQLATVIDHASLTRDLASAVHRRTQQLAQSEAWWRALVHNLTDVVIVTTATGEVTYCSPSVHAALGHRPRHITTVTDLAGQVHPDDADDVTATLRPVLLGDTRQAFIECRIARADGSWKWFEVTAVRAPDEELDGAVLTLHDVTDRRELTDRLAHQAFHDALTGLPNRLFLTDRIEDALARPSVGSIALLLLDLDDFKLINDTHGHGAGDLVLQEIGRRLEGAVRGTDVVARLGGDEFCVLLAGPPAHVRPLAERLVELIEQPIAAGGRRFVVRASVGVVFAETDGRETAMSLLSHADIALYEAKARDKGGIVVVDGADRELAANQVALREAIARPNLSEFYVVYQPVVDVSNGVVRGVEALLRWRHPVFGEISPADFIPLAEHGGSIRTLGWFVLEEACRQLAEWSRTMPHHRLALGVNASIQQLDEPGFAARVCSIVASHGLEMDQLVLELTEQSLARDFETAVAVVRELRGAGVSVAVDDFGTGYSSLRYLHRFAADVVKIDRSFVASLVDSDHTQKLVGSVMHMAQALDLQTIAEGIETVEQLELVRSLGCELAQGYLFARPGPANEIDAIVARGGVLTVEQSEPVAV